MGLLIKMKKTALLLLCLSVVLWSKTWDSFTMLGNEDRYFFGHDSLEHLAADANRNGIFIYSIRYCYGGLKHDMDYGMRKVVQFNAFEKTPFDYVTNDSIWIPKENFGKGTLDTLKFLNGSFAKDDFEYLDISQDSLLKMNTKNSYDDFLTVYDSTLKYLRVEVNLFVYQKHLAYKALCYRIYSWSSYGSALYCRYQDDESWNFGGGVFFERSLWNDTGYECDYDDYRCNDGSDSIYCYGSRINDNIIIHRNLHIDNSYPYKVNGTPATKGSSNIIIQKKKQPKLQLKGNH